MKTKKILKYSLYLALVGITVGSAVVYYMFNLPDHDVQGSITEYQLTVDELVMDYLNDGDQADMKYLDEEGISSVIEISGTVSKVDQNFAGEWVVTLSPERAPTGIRCTMIKTEVLESPQSGNYLTLKGVIRSGAYFDQELTTYQPVILDDCASVN